MIAVWCLGAHVSSRDEVAQEFAEYHAVGEAGRFIVYRYCRVNGDLPDEPIKLLEVSNEAVPAGVLPIYFGASKGVPYPIVRVELTLLEFAALEGGELELPAGWDDRQLLVEGGLL